jgi:peptidoglycan/LPS O-acetylase OafA/YrhL
LFKDDRVCKAVACTALLLLTTRELIPGFRGQPWMQYVVLAFALPFVLQATKRIRWDRALGNLSYSVYLLHWPVLIILNAFELATGLLVSLATLVIATVVYIFVEAPVDRWRQHRIKSAELQRFSARPSNTCGVRAFVFPAV